MDPEVVALGKRIRESMPSGMSQKMLAQKISMKEDALSRIFSGQRGISALELARVANAIETDSHFLLTGEQNPHRHSIAARHVWDADTKTHSNPSQDEDENILEKIFSAYREAYPDGPPRSAPLPKRGVETRQILGDDFVRTFADRIESEFAVDVIRVPQLLTDYSLTIGGRGIIVLSTEGKWFRSNWSLAHELGHLALAHHEVTGTKGTDNDANERAANAYAAELLLPKQVMNDLDWEHGDNRLVADFVWHQGVSTTAVRNRIDSLKKPAPHELRDALTLSTIKFLRTYSETWDPHEVGARSIAERKQAASARRFPPELIAALETRVEAGDTDPRTLAWVLDVPVEDIDFPEITETMNESAVAAMTPPPIATITTDMIAGATKLR